MRVRWHDAALAAVLPLMMAAPAAAEISVRFVAPERYSDADSRYGSGPPLRVTLGEIRRIFLEFGGRILQPGETLAIEVLDIDLAGFDQPGANFPNGLRVVSDTTPPRLRLRYLLTARGRSVLSAEETVTDLNFLTRWAGRTGATSFTYERELIRDWLQTRIAGRRPP